MSRLRVAVIGAGPAGIYAADALVKSGADVAVDILEKLPTPYGLVRYGVAPDHERIKEVVRALEVALRNPAVRFFGNVEFGEALKLDDLHEFYDATIIATGAMADRALGIPGEDLSYGAADFVGWYNAHPDVPRTWPLRAESVAVLGAGNVALDVARILAKSKDELSGTDIPPHVADALADQATRDVHVFARRGPAEVKFSPLELRELGRSPNFEVIVHPDGFEVNDAGLAHVAANKQAKMVLDILQNWVVRDPADRPSRIHLHFLEQPISVIGQDGTVTALRTERTRLTADGRVEGTGEITDWPMQAVYRAVGYRSSAVPGIPFDEAAAVVPNSSGRVLDLDGRHIPGLYVTGWIKRGPVGLIGHTKADAQETVACLLQDIVPSGERPDIVEVFGAQAVTLDGWRRIDAEERSLGAAAGKTRTKICNRDDMLRVANHP